MKQLLRTLLVLILLSACVVTMYAFVRAKSRPHQDYTLLTVGTGSVAHTAIAVGEIQPRQKFQIKSKMSGIVSRALVRVGDTVSAGAALIEMMPDTTPQELIEVDRRVESAQASYDRLGPEYERALQLSNDGLVAKSQLAAARELSDLAHIALVKAQQDRELARDGRVAGHGTSFDLVIRAPSAGTLLSLSVNPGDHVVPLTSYQPGTELASLADMSDLMFKGTADEIDVGQLRIGMRVQLKVGALPDEHVTGRLARIAPQAQQKDGATLFDLEIELDRSRHSVLRAGYSANAELILAARTGVVLVPERVITYDREGKRAFVEVPGEGPEHAPKQVEIVVGVSDGLNVEVVSGLKAGDQIVERPPRAIS